MTFFRFIFRFRWYVVAATLLITLILAWPIRHLKINADLTSYLPRTDPAVRTLEHVADTFGGNFISIVALESDELFSPSTLEAVRDLTQKLQLLEGVNYVTSLTNVLDLRKSEEGLEIGKLLSEEDFPLDEARAKSLRDYVLGKKRFRGRLVSADGRLTLIMVALRKDVDKNQVMARIEKVVEEAKLPGQVYLAGLPSQLREISRFIINDLKILSPLVTIIVLVSLYLSFRHWRGVLIPLAAVAMSTCWTLGIMSLAGVPLTIISDAIPVLLLAIGSAYSIHVINRFDETSPETKEQALAHVSTSVLLAALTTIAGFMSFVFGSYLSAIREFGIFASIGILIALILSLTFVPAMLFSVSRERPKIKTSVSTPKRISSPVLRRLEKWSFGFLRHEKITLLFFGGLIIAFAAGIPHIKRHSNMLDYFEAASDIRRSEEVLKRRIGGSIPISILIKGDIQDPALLQEMRAMESFLEQDPVVQNPLSIADYLAEMNEMMGEGENVPDTRAKVSNLLFLLEGQEGLEQLLHPDKKEAVIQAMIPNLDLGEMAALVERIETYIKSRKLQGVEMELAGSPLVYLHLDRSLIQSQFLSLALALGLIYLCVFLLVRSPTGALLGMIPIGFTLILIFGLMGYTGIPLDIATVLVGSVSIGIGIDYALHWINRFRLEVASVAGRAEMPLSGADFYASPSSSNCLPSSHSDLPESFTSGEGSALIKAVERTLRTAGKAIFINMSTVALGFMVLVMGHLIPLRRFGLLVGATMLASGLGALTLLPAVVVRTKARWLRGGARGQMKEGNDFGHPHNEVKSNWP